MQNLMKAQFDGGELQFNSELDVPARIACTVRYVNSLPNRFNESVEVTVLVDDARLSISEVEQVAIEKANLLLKKAISENG